MSVSIESGNYRLLAMSNDCLTMDSDKEGKRLSICPIHPKDDQIFETDFNHDDNSVTLRNVKYNLYVSCDSNPTAHSGLCSSQSAQKFMLEAGSDDAQHQLYIQSPDLKLYLWYAISRAAVDPPHAGLIPEGPGVGLKNWRLDAVEGH